MSETIKLRVPSKPAAEYVEHGNFGAVLKPKSVIEVSNRRFADWLVIEYGLAEVGSRTQVTEPEPEAGETPNEEVTEFADTTEENNDGGNE